MIEPDAMVPLAAAVLRLGTGEPERVLEVECGAGDGALFLAREFPRSRVRGVDSSEENVTRATGRVGLDPEGRIAFKRGGPRSLPFPDDHFDLLVGSRGGLAAGEAARVLRPGGRLLIVGGARPSRRAGLRDRLAAARLRRAGFEPLEEGDAGGSSFFLMRLGGGLGRPTSD
jgi:ubiquinone/menaquinone biosynthesis C-methylase UbiE